MAAAVPMAAASRAVVGEPDGWDGTDASFVANGRARTEVRAPRRDESARASHSWSL